MASEMQSAVRIPSPEPTENIQPEPMISSAIKRKRPSSSRSPSPRRYRSPPRGRSRTRSLDRNAPLPADIDRERAFERRRQLELRHRDQDDAPAKPLTEEQKQEAAKVEYNKLLTMRSGGTYIPPAKLRALQAQVTDKSSKEYQRMAWEALKKSIQGIINKANSGNMKMLVPELFEENLMRGRGIFCRSIMRAQMASLPFTPIYACMAAAINTKLPPIGELLVTRLIINFKKGFRRNDRAVCVSTTTFLAHLTNFQVVHELLVVEILVLLLQKPTDDSVEIAVALLKEVGQHIEEFSPKMAMLIYDQLRSVLHEADIEKRTQYAIEVLFQIRKDRYKNHPSVREDLDIIDEEDQVTHKIGLDAKGLQSQDTLNVFKFDEEYEKNEAEWKHLKAQILGEAEGSDDEEDDEDESSDEEEDVQEKELEIKDQSNRDLSDLRKSIYLTMVSSGGYEEACTRLMRIKPPVGLESEIPSMIVETCIQQKTYDKYYGMIGERFCKLNRFWRDEFEAAFAKYYDTSHRLDNNRLRIAGQFFGHLLATDAIGLHVLSVVRLTQEDTNSSNRIFLKYIFEDIVGNIGMKKLVERTREDTLQPSLQGIFPKDTKENLRFSINFFTAIGMGPLTEDMREFLKNMPAPAPPPALPAPASESDYSDTASSYSSYSSRSRSCHGFDVEVEIEVAVAAPEA
ncbi:MIF4G-domain-containing protein [Saccharata proteae CBS 121410]|uniref:Pre-mRNA-splicing factor CWC22 n=1 Tax=Saccharata proteae CBS 121410 TaxID=1314787 RepID=A0A9P4HQY3_9PEZI|nr:MIF4G-domain-containing protein [Saccharata proteae CBS 121410]